MNREAYALLFMVAVIPLVVPCGCIDQAQERPLVDFGSGNVDGVPVGGSRDVVFREVGERGFEDFRTPESGSTESAAHDHTQVFGAAGSTEVPPRQRQRFRFHAPEAGSTENFPGNWPAFGGVRKGGSIEVPPQRSQIHNIPEAGSTVNSRFADPFR